MKNLHTGATRKINYKVWIPSFLTAVLLVLVINVVAGYGNPDVSFAQTASTDNPNEQICANNLQDTCIMAPSVDLYPSGKEDATNPSLRNQKGDNWKSIGGIVTGINGSEIQLRTTSSRDFTVTFPFAVQTWWNQVRGPHYSNYRMDVGDTLRIDYLEPADKASTHINPDQIMHSVIAIDPVVKGEPIQRYPQ